MFKNLLDTSIVTNKFKKNIIMSGDQVNQFSIFMNLLVLSILAIELQEQLKGKNNTDTFLFVFTLPGIAVLCIPAPIQIRSN